MELLLLTEPNLYPGEAEELSALLETPGFELLLRKPGAKEEDLARLLGQIETQHHRRIWLRGQPILTLEFNLAGHHFSENERSQATCWRRRLKQAGRGLSTACHLLEELPHLEGYDRFIFSPVFNSISKPGHKPGFAAQELTQALERSKTPVFGLGGVLPGKLAQMAHWGLKGAALLGAVWSAQDRATTLTSLIEEAKAL